MKTNQIFQQFFRFASVGLTGTGVQYACLGLALHYYGDTVAVMGSAIGYIMGSIVNYILNYFFTFGSTQSHLEAASKYLIILTMGWFFNIIMMSVMVNHWQWGSWMSQLISTGIGLFWNFGGSKLWAFKSEKIQTLP